MQIRLTDSEKMLLKKAAELNGIPVSVYVRLALLNANLRNIAPELKKAKKR